MTIIDPVTRRLRLPPFVTAASVEAHLQWVNGTRRRFTEAAVRDPRTGWMASSPDDAFYDGVVELLSRAQGARLMWELVIAADPKNKRGLLHALYRAAAKALLQARFEGGGITEDVRRLCEADHLTIAAWIAFETLASFEGPAEVSPEVGGLVALIEQSEPLQEALGDYWVDWRDGATASPADPPTVSLADAQVLWTREVADLCLTIQAAQAFDGTVLARLRVGLAVLEPLQAWAAEREAHDAAVRAQEIGAMVERVRRRLQEWPGSPEWSVHMAAVLASTPHDEPRGR